MTRRKPEEYNWAKLEFDETILDYIKNYPRRTTSRQGAKIEAIVIHHMAMVGRGDGKAADACVNAWRNRPASAHYCVDGPFIRQTVWDNKAAWAVGNLSWNRKTISIEHANETRGPAWKVSADTIRTGAKLVAYLHWVYKLGRPVSGKTLRQHDEFTNTACPGPFLGGSYWNEYVALCQKHYDDITGSPKPPVQKPKPTGDVKHYIVRSGDTLSAIARKFGTTVAKLTSWNKLPNANEIEVGQDLIVSEGASPVVEPSKNRVNLKNQKVTLPTGAPGRPKEVKQPQLATYQDKNFRWIDSVLVCMAECDGVTTENTKFPRTELREMTSDGKKEIAWSNKSGTHELIAALAITHVPKIKPHVVCAQIHDGKTKVIMIRLEGQRLFIEDANGKDVGMLDGQYKLGQKFYLRIIATKKGIEVRYQRAGSSSVVVKHVKKVGSNWYFKLGCYTQATSRVSKSDPKYGTGHAEVRIYALDEVHTTREAA